MVRKQKISTKKRVKPEMDSVYFLKLVMYFIFGTFWLHVGVGSSLIPLPVGFGIGMAFAMHDHFKIDRKIEYAILLVAMFITYFLSPRLVVAL